MYNKFARFLAPLLLKGEGHNNRISIAICLAIVSPVVLIAGFAYNSTYHDLTEAALARRKSIAVLASTVIEQQFNRLTDLGVSFATRVRFRQLVSQGNWDQAIETLNDVVKDFPFIDRVFLADPTGTLTADTPVLPGVRRRNFAMRDWYQGVSRDWKPYVSDVYRRAAEPRHNVVAVAVPIRGKDEEINGILVLQVQLNALVEWSKSIDMESPGFTYITDRKGRLATHPKLPSAGEIFDHSNLPVVQHVLRGRSGIETIVDPVMGDERVAAYAPVAGLGWGVIVTEPLETAFAKRDGNLSRLIIRHGLIFLLSCGLAYVILRAVLKLKEAEEKIQTLNRELQQRAIRLERANKELEAFSYSVSHDLRAPLRSIDGFSEALVEDYGDKLDGQGKNYLQRVRAATRRMGMLIDDLLNLSRVSRGEIRAEGIDLSALAQEVALELRKAEPDRHVDLRIEKDIRVVADRRLLRIAMENLIGNAWKFTAKTAEAQIQFGVSGGNGSRIYFVRDNGAGFDMAYASKLFGAFQRLHTTAEFNGTGIGLATVQRIIHRHNGTIWAEAKVDEGATFYFTLGGQDHDKPGTPYFFSQKRPTEHRE